LSDRQAADAVRSRIDCRSTTVCGSVSPCISEMDMLAGKVLPVFP
jgi:hypothetical protein